MSASTAEFAWENAERRTFNWLVRCTGAQEDVNAFIATYPKSINFTKDGFNWVWEINGGDVVQVASSTRPRASWKMNGKLRAVFITRKAGQEFSGRVLNKVPYDENEKDPTMYGIQTFRPITEPQLDQGTMQIADDVGDEGGELPVWLMDWDFTVVFFNTEKLV